MLLLATSYWGLSFPLMKATGQLVAAAVPEAGSWFSTAMMILPRFLLAALVLAAALGRSLRTITAAEWQQGAMLGGFAAMGMVFQADGLQFTAASTSAFLSQFYAILIPLWVALRTRRNPGARVWMCVGLVLIGVAVLGRFDWHGLHLGRGEAETLVASVFFMGQILALERPEFALNRVLPITFVMFLVEATVFGALAVVAAPTPGALVAPLSSVPWWGFTLALTVFCTLGSFLTMNKWQPRISSTEAGLLYCAEPVFSSVMSLFLPGLFSLWAGLNYANEAITGHLLVGGGFVLAANVLLQLRRGVA